MAMDAQQLFDTMKKIQEPKGYYFNKNMERTLELLEALLVNKERYGYMGCPCRLLSGDRKKDTDILCPCVYSKGEPITFRKRHLFSTNKGRLFCNLDGETGAAQTVNA